MKYLTIACFGLVSRNRTGVGEEQRNALNALLYHTGDQSQNFMMVCAFIFSSVDWSMLGWRICTSGYL